MSATSAQVVWHITMSLDGFIAGPDHAMEWAFDHRGPNTMADEVMNSTGAILGGRNWYDAATRKYRGREGIYGGKWNGPVFVLTHRPTESPADPEITFLSTGVENAVATARAAAGGRNLVNLRSQHRAPVPRRGPPRRDRHPPRAVLLGDGIRLHGGPGIGRVDLERTELAEAGQLTDLRFRVIK